MTIKKSFLLLCFIITFNAKAANPIFTGSVDEDFDDFPNCWLDPEDNNPDLTGFDIEKVCFFYDDSTDKLYVGVKAHNDAIFGDADGDGNPSDSATGGITDFAQLAESETLVFSFDLDGDSLASFFDNTTVDLLVGVSSENDITSFGAYAPGVDYDVGYPGNGFGSPIDLDVDVFASPSVLAPDLEFVIHSFTSLDLEAEYAAIPVVQIFTGSVSAGGVGSDFLPSSSELFQPYSIFDFDEDTLLDSEEIERGTDPLLSDTDGDGLPDGIEINSENPTNPLIPDTDDDGLMDGEEDLNADGILDETESNPRVKDTDGDGLTDFVEVRGDNPTLPNNRDTDGEGLTDGQEDENKNGNLDLGETDPNKADTDNGGINDFVEVVTGFDPLDPSDDDQANLASIQSGVGQGYDRIQGGGLFGCQLSETNVLNSSRASLNLACAFLVLGLAALRSKAKAKS